MTRALCLALCLLSGLATGAAASDLSRFNAAIGEADRAVRGALFYLRTGNPAVAGFELQDAVAIWNERVMAFRDAPPDAFSDETDWPALLDALASDLASAETATADSEVESAQATLTALRETLSALRARNQVRVFSDCIAEANRAMDALWVYRHEPPDFADAAAVDGLKAQTAVTAHLYRRCVAEAPAAIAEDPSFTRITEGAITSLDRLFPVIREGNPEGVINLLRELRSFDRMLWLEFG